MYNDTLAYNRKIQPLKIEAYEDRALQSQMAKVVDYSEWKLQDFIFEASLKPALLEA